jgi:hypothetical protein
MDDINLNFSLQLILMFGYILPSTMFSFYSVLRLILKNAYMKNLLILTNTIWIVAHSFIVGVSVNAGHSTTENAKEVSQIFYKTIKKLHPSKGSVRSNLKLFLKATNFRDVSLRTSFFEINLKLVFNVSSKVLVIR